MNMKGRSQRELARGGGGGGGGGNSRAGLFSWLYFFLGCTFSQTRSHGSYAYKILPQVMVLKMKKNLLLVEWHCRMSQMSGWTVTRLYKPVR